MTSWEIPDARHMHEWGKLLGSLLSRGDVVVLHGPLGAGKTTLARGIAEAIGVQGAIQSPTFVVSREHRNLSTGAPTLVHIDSYRLNHAEELVDLDVDYDNCITLIEWGRPFVERVAPEWLDIEIHRPKGGEDDEVLSVEDSPRRVTVTAHARRGVTPSRFLHLEEVLRDSRR